MTTLHKSVLYISLAFLGSSLLFPGLMTAVSQWEGDLVTTPLDFQNQLRALNGMMVAVGVLSFWCCFDLENKRQLVRALGLILLLTGVARVYSLSVDGMPGWLTNIYITVEFLLAFLLLLWPPKNVNRP